MSNISESNDHVTVSEHASDKFGIIMDIQDEGIYSVNFKIIYTYMGKQYEEKSDTARFVYFNNQKSSDDIYYQDAPENKITRNDEFDWWSGYIDIISDLHSNYTIDDTTEVQLIDFDLNGIPELHIATVLGAHEILSDYKIYYYNRKRELEYVIGSYNMIEGELPQLYYNEGKQRVQWLIGDQDLIFDKDFILTYGCSVKEICFNDNIPQLTDIANVVGVTGTNNGIPTFKIYDEYYDNVNSFYEELKSELSIQKVEYQSNFLIFYPETALAPSTDEIFRFINNYMTPQELDT